MTLALWGIGKVPCAQCAVHELVPMFFKNIFKQKLHNERVSHNLTMFLENILTNDLTM